QEESPAPTLEPPAPAAAPAEAPKPALPPPPPPTVIILEPPPAPAPVVRTEVVYVPQQPTLIYAPTTIVSPVVEVAPPPPQDVIEAPVIIVTNPTHRVPHARHPKAQQQNSTFKDIPFLPPTPRGPRWSP